jgi:hypothetical protein
MERIAGIDVPLAVLPPALLLGTPETACNLLNSLVELLSKLTAGL